MRESRNRSRSRNRNRSRNRSRSRSRNSREERRLVIDLAQPTDCIDTYKTKEQRVEQKQAKDVSAEWWIRRICETVGQTYIERK